MENLFTIKDLVEEITSNQDMAIAVHEKCRVVSFDEREGAEKPTFILKLVNKEGHSLSVWFNFETEATVMKWGDDTPGEALIKDKKGKLKHLANLALAMGLQSTLLSFEQTQSFEDDFETLRQLILTNKEGRHFNLKVTANGAGNPTVSKTGWKCYEPYVEGKPSQLKYTEAEKNKINNLSLDTNSAIINQDGAEGIEPGAGLNALLQQ
jgi:hypothetical protein